MRQKLLCTLTALGLCAALAACGGGGDKSPAGPAKSSGQTSAGQTGSGSGTPDASGSYTFTVAAANGFVVAINDDMSGVLAGLGEPQSYFEAASCAFEGLDKTYTYAGFSITTRPDKEKDFVNSILLTDDSVTTPEGVYIGCGESDVTAAYGTGTSGEGVLTYTRGDSVLNFVLEGGKVVSIEYLPA